MSHIPHAGRFRPAVLLWCGSALMLASVAACAPDAETPSPPAPVLALRPQARPLATSRDTSAAARPPAPAPPPVVFDTTEPPEAVRQIPAPPRPPPPPAPRPPGGSGSCDVRATETYCFSYTGPGWTPESAGANCAAAPSAVFGAGLCPTAGRIATCTFRRSTDPTRELVYTTYAPADLDLARLACPGTFEVVE